MYDAVGWNYKRTESRQCSYKTNKVCCALCGNTPLLLVECLVTLSVHSHRLPIATLRGGGWGWGDVLKMFSIIGVTGWCKKKNIFFLQDGVCEFCTIQIKHTSNLPSSQCDDLKPVLLALDTPAPVPLCTKPVVRVPVLLFNQPFVPFFLSFN